MASLTQNEEFLKSAFKGYDVNSDGRVTVKEIRRIMARTGEKYNWEKYGLLNYCLQGK